MVFLWGDDVVAGQIGIAAAVLVEERAIEVLGKDPDGVATWWELLVRYSNYGCEGSHLSRKLFTI
jgi:hypothetical protein